MCLIHDIITFSIIWQRIFLSHIWLQIADEYSDPSCCKDEFVSRWILLDINTIWWADIFCLLNSFVIFKTLPNSSWHFIENCWSIDLIYQLRKCLLVDNIYISIWSKFFGLLKLLGFLLQISFFTFLSMDFLRDVESVWSSFASTYQDSISRSSLIFINLFPTKRFKDFINLIHLRTHCGSVQKTGNFFFVQIQTSDSFENSK